MLECSFPRVVYNFWGNELVVVKATRAAIGITSLVQRTEQIVLVLVFAFVAISSGFITGFTRLEVV